MGRTTQRVRPAERRAQILTAAQSCFIERGYHETTIDHIAERCGLSKGAIYWHFPGKRELFLALFDRYCELSLAVHGDLDEDLDASEALLRIAQATLVEVPDLPSLVELTLEYLAHAGRDPDLQSRFRHLYSELGRLLIEQVERGIRDRRFREVDPEVVSRALFALGDGLLVQKVLFPDLDLACVAREGIDLILRGLKR
ncbi:MAG: TetR/AcrR family transcriptional regulator [Myxococcota bacterium]